MFALRSVGAHVVPVAFRSRLVVRGDYWFVRMLLERGGEGGVGGEGTVGQGAVAATQRRW